MTTAKKIGLCPQCGKGFNTVYPKQKFCCVPCAFWSSVEPASVGCWEWTGACTGFGYGEFRYMGKLVRAHRYSYELHYGPIGPGLIVRHECDNPRCCNPLHLSAGTQKDNMNDAAVRYRNLKKMTIDKTMKAEQMLLSGTRMSDVARAMNVSHSTIRTVRNRMRRAGIDI